MATLRACDLPHQDDAGLAAGLVAGLGHLQHIDELVCVASVVGGVGHVADGDKTLMPFLSWTMATSLNQLEAY